MLNLIFNNPIHPLLGCLDSISSPTKNNKEACDQLAEFDTNNSHTCIVYLKDRLSSITKGSEPVVEFYHDIKALVDELATTGASQGDVDFLIYCLRELRLDYKEIVTALRAYDTSVTFEELHDKLVEHKDF